MDLKEVKQMIKFIKPTVDDVYKSYSFIDIDKKEYEDLIKEVTDNIKDTSDIKDQVIKITKSILINKVKNLILNSKTSFKIINNYINQNLNNCNNYNDALNFFKSLSLFLSFNEYIPTPEIIIELLNKNLLFNKATDLIIEKNKKQILNGNIDKIFTNNLLILTIDTYCILNDIETNNYEEENSTNNLESLDILKQYLKEIGKYPILDSKQENQLALKIKQGDKEAKDLFIKSNLKLVVSIAKKYVGRGLALLDLVQDGNLGLMKAVDKFDVDKGYKFSTYATWWIRQSIARGIMDKSKTIKIPVHQYEKFLSYNKVINNLTMSLNRPPTLKEVASELNVKEDDIAYVYNLMIDPISISVKVGEEKETELSDFIESDDKPLEDLVGNKFLADSIEELFKEANLNEKEIQVLKLRFGFDNKKPLTLKEIAIQYGLTRERIRQIQENALFKLRKTKFIDGFEEYTSYPNKSLSYLKNIKETCHGNISYLNYKKYTAKPGTGNKKIQTIYQYFSKYTKEQINESLSQMTDQEIEVITLKYGPDLNKPVYNILADDEIRKRYKNAMAKLKRILSKYDDLENEYKANIKVLKDFKWENIFNNLTKEEALIFCLKLGFIDDECYETEKIANFFKIDEQEVIKIVKKVLFDFRKELLDSINPAVNYIFKSLEKEKRGKK